jgi:hypothetical protein
MTLLTPRIEYRSDTPSENFVLQLGVLDLRANEVLPPGKMPIIAFHWTWFQFPPSAQSLN